MAAEKSPAARAHEAIERLRPLSHAGHDNSPVVRCDTCDRVQEAHAALDEAVREAEQKTVNAHHAWVRETFGWGACEWRKDANQG